MSLLIGLLLDGTDPNEAQDDEMASTMLGAETTLSQLSRSVAPTSTRVPHSGQAQHRLLQILNGVDFREESLKTPQWEVFDPAQVRD